MKFLRRLFPDREHVLLMAAREIADAQLRKAVLSGVTQRKPDAFKAMRDATHAQMAHELRMRGHKSANS
jgi:hypothetical protein